MGLTRNTFQLYITLLLVAMMLVSCHHHPVGTESRAEQLDSALATMTQSKLAAIADSMTRAEDWQGEMLVRSRLGKLLRNESQFDSAIEQHNRALELACQLCDTIEIVRALNNLGTNFRRLGIMEEATSFHYQALAYCDQYSEKRSQVARKNRVISLNGIGNIYMTMHNLEMADSVLRAALAGEQELGSALGQAINWANLGAIQEERGRLDSARVCYEKSMQLNREAGSLLGQSLCYTHYGELSEKQDRLDEARDHYRRAYDMLSQGDDTWHWLEACQALARVSIARGDLAQARRYINLSDSAAATIHSLEHQARALRLQYLLDERQGDVRGALDHYIAFKTLDDSVTCSRNMSHLQNTRVNFERQRRQAELDLLSENYRNERWLKHLLMAVVALIVVLAGVVIYLMRVKNHNQLMANQMLADQLLRLGKEREPDSGQEDDARWQLNADDRQFMERFTAVIDQSIDAHQVDMESIASQLCLTSSQMRRRVQAITGMNPLAYVSGVRMAKARRLLLEHPEMPIGDIAEQCGFYDMAHFSRLFKKTYQLTPSQFRRG